MMSGSIQKPGEIGEYISSINVDNPGLDQTVPQNIDSAIRMAKQNNENIRIQTVLDVWRRQQDAERQLRKTYAGCFMWFLGAQLVVLNVIFALIGFGIVKYRQWTVNIFIISVFGEIISTIAIIVRNLFKTTGKEMIELIKEQK